MSFSDAPNLKITFNSSLFSKNCKILFYPEEITCKLNNYYKLSNDQEEMSKAIDSNL